MPNVQTIKSYLVKLGFEVDRHAAGQVVEHLKKFEADAERLAVSVTNTFAATGLAVAGALTAAAVGLGDLFVSTARSDMQFQMLGRRMLMSTDDARKMKIATDALGVSLEDIISGPPELRERYKALVDYQGGLSRRLLGDDFEGSMRKMRDVEFEFTKMGVAAQYLGMSVVSHLITRLTGSGSLDEALKKVDMYLSPEKIEEYSTAITNLLGPALEGAYHWLEKIFTKKNIEIVINAVGDAWDRLEMLYKFLQDPGKAVYGSGGLWDKDKGIGDNLGFLLGPNGLGFERIPDVPLGNQKVEQGKIMLEALRDAAKYKISPSLFAGLISHESSFNPNALNPDSGAFGLGQFLPNTGKLYGVTPQSPWDQNLEAAAHYFSDLLKKHGGNVDDTLKEYGGYKKKDPSAYANDIKRRAYSIEHGQYQPQALHIQSDVHITVQGSNATADEIANKAAKAVVAHIDNAVRRNIAEGQSVYAV